MENVILKGILIRYKANNIVRSLSNFVEVFGMSRIDRLKMGNVETKHFQQFNQLLRYVFQVTKRDLQMVGWEEREIALAKKPVLDQADVLGGLMEKNWYHN